MKWSLTLLPVESQWRLKFHDTSQKHTHMAYTRSLKVLQKMCTSTYFYRVMSLFLWRVQVYIYIYPQVFGEEAPGLSRPGQKQNQFQNYRIWIFLFGVLHEAPPGDVARRPKHEHKGKNMFPTDRSVFTSSLLWSFLRDRTPTTTSPSLAPAVGPHRRGARAPLRCRGRTLLGAAGVTGATGWAAVWHVGRSIRKSEQPSGSGG